MLPTSAGALLFTSSLIHMLPLYGADELSLTPHSFVLLKNTLNYSLCFMHDTATVSPDLFENQIRERFLGHVCETCQKISLDGFSRVFFSVLWTWKCEVIFSFFYLF